MAGRNRLPPGAGIVENSRDVEREVSPRQVTQAALVQCIQEVNTDLRQRLDRVQNMQLRHDSADIADEIREEQMYARIVQGISGALNQLLNRDGNSYRWGRKFTVDELVVTIERGARQAAETLREFQLDREVPRSVENKISQIIGHWDRRFAEMADSYRRESR